MNSLDYQHIFHEIKNTITLINSSMQLLDNKCPPLMSEPYWDNIKHEITYLKNMILEISQVGNIDQLQKESLDLNSLLTDICRFMKDAYPDLQWNLHLCKNLPYIYADNIKLRQAILNLLKNSAETDSEYITITTETADSFVKITIADLGGGISKDYEDKIFQLFTTSKEHGTGLGLAITKQIIESHNGTIQLENHPNKGCTFIICLPANSIS